MGTFPVTRLRRFRRTAALRSLVRETRLSLDDFVYPLFACPGEGSSGRSKGFPASRSARWTSSARRPPTRTGSG